VCVRAEIRQTARGRLLKASRGCGEGVTITKLGSIIGFDSVAEVLKGLSNLELNLKAFKLGYAGGGFEC
jgi:hypothetical protein